MKLLLSLILIITIALNIAIGSKFGDQECFTPTSPIFQGYSGEYKLFSYNGNVLTSQGVAQETSYEEGSITVDYPNQSLFVSYKIDFNNDVSNGLIYAFSENSTEYIVTNKDGVNECFSDVLTYDIPSQEKLVYLSDINLGTIDTEVFQVVSSSNNYANQTKLVNKNDCTVTSINSVNIVEATGYTMMNIYNSQPPIQNNILPSICFSSPQSKSKLSNKFKLPKSLQFHIIE